MNDSQGKATVSRYLKGILQQAEHAILPVVASYLDCFEMVQVAF